MGGRFPAPANPCIDRFMALIGDTVSLEAFCGRVGQSDFVAVDTEFIRDKTYWPRLCLVQIAGAEECAAVDAMAPGIDLAPLRALMGDASVLKVFHAARQDIEIFYHLDGRVPAPVFDTQVAAMVCGFGEQAAYERLARELARAAIDKSQRVLDWSRRPLPDRMLDYALSDVTHLRTIYEALAAKLARNRRSAWLDEEMAVLTDPESYRLDPAQAWRRVRHNLRKPRQLALLRRLAEWRENEARRRDLPRGWILDDKLLARIAALEPRNAEDLERLRAPGRGRMSRAAVQAAVDVAAEIRAAPPDSHPAPERAQAPPAAARPAVELLKVLLKLRCEENGVAQKLVASAEDVAAIADDDGADVAALRGWRREIFGADALALKHGRIALTLAGGGLDVVPRGG